MSDDVAYIGYNCPALLDRRLFLGWMAQLVSLMRGTAREPGSCRLPDDDNNNYPATTIVI